MALLAACAAGSDTAVTITAGEGSQASNDSGMRAASTGGGSSGSVSPGATPAGLPPCDATAIEDRDQDGFTLMAGDCYDCDARVNPGAFDVPENGIDDDCSGADAQGKIEACDAGLALSSFDPKDGARAMGLCVFARPQDNVWGVLSAAYVSADGSRPLSMSDGEHEHVGLVPSFGPEAPRAGSSMLALSSGIARAPGQAGFDIDRQCGAYYTSGLDGWPMRYPRKSPACSKTGDGGGGGGGAGQALLHDPAALELTIRVPTNAKGFSFDTSFFTYEYPDYICSQYNDYFLVLMDPAPAEHPDGNLVFDSQGNWISVNNGLLQVCSPGEHQGKTFTCPLGSAGLKGTGYADQETACGEGAGTGWLKTVVPVTPGTVIRLRFTIWDTGDPNRDSTALVDHFVWNVDAPKAIETTVVVQ